MSNIIKVSKIVRWLVAFLGISHCASFALMFFFGEIHGASNQIEVTLGPIYYVVSVDVGETWSEFAKALEAEHFNSLLLLGSVDILPYIIGYILLFRLFGLYQQGQIFNDSTLRYIRYIGISFIAWIGVRLLYPLLVTLVLRLSGASDSLALYFSISSNDFMRFLVGMVIYVIAWIMAEANKLQQEQELTI